MRMCMCHNLARVLPFNSTIYTMTSTSLQLSHIPVDNYMLAIMYVTRHLCSAELHAAGGSEASSPVCKYMCTLCSCTLFLFMLWGMPHIVA